ncbi:MAG: hypothetical protein WAL32_03575, partial [Terriglobales bacterium]
MNRERALKVVLVVVGLRFCADVYPLILMMKQDRALEMWGQEAVKKLSLGRRGGGHRFLEVLGLPASLASPGLLARHVEAP